MTADEHRLKLWDQFGIGLQSLTEQWRDRQMKKQEMLAKLREWESRMKALEEQLEKLSELMGSAEDNSPLIKRCCFIQEAYTEAVSEIIGGGDWLRTWWLEWGFKGSCLNVEVMGVEFPAKTLEDLATIIDADR